MQLVLSGNRVVGHGENFLSMGGVVINTETGKRYENATVAECEGCPSDIDEVGYEYHAGAFVPCAPYGKGDGNLAVVCNDDCKSIKDSGYLLPNYANRQFVASGTMFILFYGSANKDSTYEYFSGEKKEPGCKFAMCGFRPLIGGAVKIQIRYLTSHQTTFALYMQEDNGEPIKIRSGFYLRGTTIPGTFTHEVSVQAGVRYTFYFDYAEESEDFDGTLRIYEFSVRAIAPDGTAVSEVWSRTPGNAIAIIDPIAQLRADVDYIAAQAGVTL